MELFQSADGPALDVGLERRLRRLDPRLKVTFSHWAIDPQRGQPIEDLLTGRPILNPAQHLWLKTEAGWKHINEFPMDQGGFGHINVSFLEIDRWATTAVSEKDLFRKLQGRQEARKELERKRHTDWRQDRAQANKHRMLDLAQGKSGQRQGRMYSYAGQTSRRTPGTLLSDAKEDGWELE